MPPPPKKKTPSGSPSYILNVRSLMIELTFPKGIDVNKTSASKECYFCHYCSFLN